MWDTLIRVIIIINNSSGNNNNNSSIWQEGGKKKSKLNFCFCFRRALARWSLIKNRECALYNIYTYIYIIHCGMPVANIIMYPTTRATIVIITNLLLFCFHSLLLLLYNCRERYIRFYRVNYFRYHPPPVLPPPSESRITLYIIRLTNVKFFIYKKLIFVYIVLISDINFKNVIILVERINKLKKYWIRTYYKRKNWLSPYW